MKNFQWKWFYDKKRENFCEIWIILRKDFSWKSSYCEEEKKLNLVKKHKIIMDNMNEYDLDPELCECTR
jgi:hypothetical protein